MKQWIGVDFDGTLAHYECNWRKNYKATGDPIFRMVQRVKRWIAKGNDVRIFTARMDCYHPSGRLSVRTVKTPIEAWCRIHLGKVLPITNRKDHWCKAIYDDRAYHVEINTGKISEEHND
jgi:hypothetical protein